MHIENVTSFDSMESVHGFVVCLYLYCSPRNENLNLLVQIKKMLTVNILICNNNFEHFYVHLNFFAGFFFPTIFIRISSIMSSC